MNQSDTYSLNKVSWESRLKSCFLMILLERMDLKLKSQITSRSWTPRRKIRKPPENKN